MDAERTLVDRAARGRDEAAFERLLDLHADHAYGLALRLTGDANEAEDATAEAIAAAWFALPRFAGRGTFRAWLHGIVANRVRQRRRARTRRLRRVVPVADPAAWERAVAETFPGTKIDLERALTRLPPRARETLLLRHSSGLSYDEIGEAMRVSIGTVKSQLARAYALMREELSL